MSKRRSLRRSALLALAAPIAALFACNAILGAGDYKVGDGSDGGSEPPPGQDDGGSGNMGTGGAGPTGTGGKAAGSGGKAVGSGGKAAGTGGVTAPGGGPGAGGRGSGGKGSGGTNPGTGGGPTPPGGSAGTGPLTAADFVGEWDTDAETLTTECTDGEPPTTEVTGDTFEWTSGSGGTIETIFGPCTIVASISGRVATIVPAPPCDDAGIGYSFSGTFTILANGTARLDQTVIASNAPASCTLTATGVFTKYVPGTF